MQDEFVYDVVQIGYGPVSQVLALMLGRQGHRIAVVERWSELYTLPRAVCIDAAFHGGHVADTGEDQRAGT